MSFVESDKFEGSALECARYASGYFEFSDLEKETGIKSVRLVRIETGRDYPTNKEIDELARATGVKPKFFYSAWIKPPEYSFNFRR